MTEYLSVILGFRDRDGQRVDRCLQSLHRQSFTDFRVIFVDYGSSSSAAAEARRIVKKYPFCTYIYNDTRGYAWNRAHALNSGLRLAPSPFVMTSDVDMIFPGDFLEKILARGDQRKVIYCPVEYLPKGFSDWERVESHSGQLQRATKGALGGCQLAPTAVLSELRGFDEYYRYWGREDRDLHERLVAWGLQPEWIVEETTLFHQWHPLQNNRVVGYMPDSTWNRMQLHYLRSRGELQRNDEQWGRILTAEQRPVYRFLDFEQSKLRSAKNLHLLDVRPDDVRSISKLTNLLKDLAPGHAVVVNHANFPRRRPGSDTFLRFSSLLMHKIGLDVRFDYGRNHVHSFLVDFIDQNWNGICDYYLGFPALDGVSVVLGKQMIGTERWDSD